MKSGLNALMCVTLPIAFATIVLTMVVFFEFAVANLLFESPCGPNKAYRQNILGSAETASSPMECSVLCLDKDNCRSFTYNRGDERCELSSGLERICSLLTVETGSTYYVVDVPGCDGPSRQVVGRDSCICSPGYFGSDCIQGCLNGFTALNGTGTCYYISLTKGNHTTAKADCEARGVMLACPETEAELIEISKFLKTVFTGNQYVAYGITDLAEQGTWVCEGTGKTVVTAHAPGEGVPLFDITQPDQIGGAHCTIGRGHKDFYLHDLYCTNPTFFLCEQP